VQYAKIKKHFNKTGTVKVNKTELKEYYDKNILRKQALWKEKLGDDLNWNLSFDHLRESDTTKHVHRLHPYKGKFIPQLVEYFLDKHVNTFKKNVFFHDGDIILDPFVGSGTTLVQASELGLHSIGIDVSAFNCLMSKVKTTDYDFDKLNDEMTSILTKTKHFSNKTFDDSFNIELRNRISQFNKKYFPNSQFKHDVNSGKVNEKEYGSEKLAQFLEENKVFLKENGTKDRNNLFTETEMFPFLTMWFSERIRHELFYYLNLIEKIENKNVQNMMQIVLSRTARSCRSTTHSDLATLKKPQKEPYYCYKHKKLCTPINTALKHLKKNTNDTINRLKEFSKLKKNVNTIVIGGDSREVNIFDEVKKQNSDFYPFLLKEKIDGIFTSPPYVGQIDYHKQHTYAYDLFNITKREDKEIGPQFKGKSKKAREEYVEGISAVLRNISPFVKENGNFFIVANDKYDLYPTIAEKSNLKIVNKFKRPVLNRTERDRQPYAEIIFHMKKI